MANSAKQLSKWDLKRFQLALCVVEDLQERYWATDDRINNILINTRNGLEEAIQLAKEYRE